MKGIPLYSPGLIAVALTLACQSPAHDPARQHLETRGVTALLDVMDAIGAEHPDVTARTAALAALPSSEREAALDIIRAKNESSANVATAMDSLFATETYQIYFRRFPNVTPELFEDLLLDLPYRQRNAPGDTGGLFYNLIRERAEVRSAFTRLIDEVDMPWVYDTAENWVPRVVGDRPAMHLIYDSNAGSFATEGRAFLNVYNSLDLNSLLSDPIDDAMREAHGTMAHELQHVLAGPTLHPEFDGERNWQASFVDRLVRGMVGEGLAFHCYPPAGTLKEVYEDREVIETLIGRLGDLLNSLRDDDMTEEEVRTWYRDNYFAHAEALLRRHLSKSYSGDSLEQEMRERISFRPDVEHALGWWMTSRVSDRGARRNDAVGLLEDPYAVFRRYDQAVSDQGDSLRLPGDVIAYVESLGPRSAE